MFRSKITLKPSSISDYEREFFAKIDLGTLEEDQSTFAETRTRKKPITSTPQTPPRTSHKQQGQEQEQEQQQQEQAASFSSASYSPVEEEQEREHEEEEYEEEENESTSQVREGSVVSDISDIGDFNGGSSSSSIPGMMGSSCCCCSCSCSCPCCL